MGVGQSLTESDLQIDDCPRYSIDLAWVTSDENKDHSEILYVAGISWSDSDRCTLTFRLRSFTILRRWLWTRLNICRWLSTSVQANPQFNHQLSSLISIRCNVPFNTIWKHASARVALGLCEDNSSFSPCSSCDHSFSTWGARTWR